jgi:hypothetical protein
LVDSWRTAEFTLFLIVMLKGQLIYTTVSCSL